MILNLEAGSLFTGSIEKNQRYTVIVVLSTSNELTLHYMYNTKNKCSIRICRVSFSFSKRMYIDTKTQKYYVDLKEKEILKP